LSTPNFEQFLFCQLILLARSEKKLRALTQSLESQYPITATVLPKDLAQPGAPIEIFEALQKLNRQVDMLVNNGTDCAARPKTQQPLTQQPLTEQNDN